VLEAEAQHFEPSNRKCVRGEMFEERECTRVDEALLNNTYESLAELTPGHGN
jgi:hypothetical protein